jgi:ArsR family transcriptional regulator
MVKVEPGTGAIVRSAVGAVAGIHHFEYSGNMDEQDVVKALAALAQPVRLKVFRALVVTGEAGLTPGTMAEGLDIPANTLSFHLKELVNAGLVTQERSSRNLIYRAAYPRMNALLGYLTENCCQGADCGVPAARCC